MRKIILTALLSIFCAGNLLQAKEEKVTIKFPDSKISVEIIIQCELRWYAMEVSPAS